MCPHSLPSSLRAIGLCPAALVPTPGNVTPLTRVRPEAKASRNSTASNSARMPHALTRPPRVLRLLGRLEVLGCRPRPLCFQAKCIGRQVLSPAQRHECYKHRAVCSPANIAAGSCLNLRVKPYQVPLHSFSFRDSSSSSSFPHSRTAARPLWPSFQLFPLPHC